MPRLATTCLLCLAAVLAALAAGCGEATSAADTGGNGVDRAFAAEMVPHHLSAIEMAEVAERRGQRRQLRRLAGGIAHVQDEEVLILRREDAQLARADVERGELGVPAHATGMHDGNAERLRRVAADDVDRTFVELMVPHHEGAIAMAEAELAKGTDPELRDLAQRIVDSQRREIAFMRGLVGDDGGATAGSPDGGQAHGHGAGDGG